MPTATTSAPGVQYEDTMTQRSSYASSSSSRATGAKSPSPKSRTKLGQKLIPALPLPLSIHTDRLRRTRRQVVGEEDELQIVVTEEADTIALPSTPPTPSYVSARRPAATVTSSPPRPPRRIHTNSGSQSPTRSVDLEVPRPAYARAKSPSGDSVSTVSEATTPRVASSQTPGDAEIENAPTTTSARKRDSTQRRLNALRGLVANLDFNQHWSVSDPAVEVQEDGCFWACADEPVQASSSSLSLPDLTASGSVFLHDVPADRPRANRNASAPAGPVPDLEILDSPPRPRSGALSPSPSDAGRQSPVKFRSLSRAQAHKKPRKFSSASELAKRSQTPEPPRPSSRMRLEVFDVAVSGYSKCLEPVSPTVPTTPTATWKSTLSSEEIYHEVMRSYGAPEVKRQEVMWELRETEQSFVTSLKHVMRLFAAPLKTPSCAWIQGIPPRITELFDFLQTNLDSHARLLGIMRQLRQKGEVVDVTSFVDCLDEWLPSLTCHEAYIIRFEGVVQLVEENVRDPSSFFGEFVRMQMKDDVLGSMSLGSMLLKPVQRLTKYPLFIRRLLDATPYPHPCHADILQLLSRTESIILNLQNTKAREEDFEHLQALEGRMQGLPVGMTLAVRGRKLLAQGQVVRVPTAQKELSVTLRSRATSQHSHSSRASISSTLSSTCSSPWDHSSSTTPSTARTSAFSISSSSSSHCPPSRSGSLIQTSPRRMGMSRSPSSVSTMSESRPLSPGPMSGSLRGLKRKEEVLTMFIFNDLLLLATESSDKLGLFSGKKREKMFKVLPESVGGIGKVAEVNDWSGWQGE